MALVLNDRVKETTTTTGTGAVSLGGAATGFETFAQGIGNSNTTYYAIIHESADEWEVGLGTLDGDSSDLTRTTVLTSSNSDSAVNFSSGNKTVICTLPASKAVVLDADGDVTLGANLDVGGNLTVTGLSTLNGGTLTLGDADTDNIVFGGEIDSDIIPDDDGTFDLGSASKEWQDLFIDGTANIDSLVADTADINGGTIDGVTIGGSSAGAITGTTITGTSFVIGSANINETELETIDGVTAGTVAASKAVVVDANKDIASFRNVTLTGELDGGSLDISGDADIDGTTNLDVVDIDGAVDMATTLDVAGIVTANAGVVIDNITIDGTEIDLSSGDLTLDVAGDIVLDAAGNDIKFNAGGTAIAEFTNSSTDFIIKSVTSDKDLIFKGNDGGSEITALTLDMSAAGLATFNAGVTTGGNIIIPDDGNIGSASDTDAIAISSGGAVTFSQNVIITGTLDVNGTVTTIDTTNLTVTDPLVKYGQGSTGTSVDQGFIVTRGDGSSSNTANRGFIWDESADEFATVAANTEAGTTAGNVTINDYADIHVGKITADDASVFSAGASFGDANITNVGSIAVDSIINDATDILIDSAGDIILDAAGNDWSFKSGGTEVLKITNSSSDVIIKPIVDAKDLIFQQRDGTEVARIEDNGTFNVVTAKLAINGTAITSTAAELNLLDGVSGLVQADLTKLAAVDSTAAELNIMDGDTSATSTTMADADRVVVNDNGTMKQVAMTDISTYTDGGATALAIALG